MEPQVREIIAALNKAVQKVYHVQTFVSTHSLTDEEAEEVGKALDVLFEYAEAADDALFESEDVATPE